MCPVVLNGDQFCTRLLCEPLCITCRQELRVSIVGDHLIFHAQQPTEVFHCLLQVRECLGVPYISHMRGSNSKPILVDRRVGVQLRTYPEDGPVTKINFCPLRGDTPRKPDDMPVADDRVIATVDDDPVMGQKIVHLPVHLRHRLVNVRYHRVPGQVRACHNQERIF